MIFIQAVARLILDIAYVWAFVMAAFFVALVVTAELRNRRRRRVVQLDHEAERHRRDIREERERRELFQANGWIERSH